MAAFGAVPHDASVGVVSQDVYLDDLIDAIQASLDIAHRTAQDNYQFGVVRFSVAASLSLDVVRTTDPEHPVKLRLPGGDKSDETPAEQASFTFQLDFTPSKSGGGDVRQNKNQKLPAVPIKHHRQGDDTPDRHHPHKAPSR